VRKQDILADIPPRPVVDRLIAKCFNSMDIAPSKSINYSLFRSKAKMRQWLFTAQHFCWR
jgi:hypothetical protein